MLSCQFVQEPLDTFVSESRLHFPDATQDPLEDAVRRACHEFTRRTGVLECDIPIQVQANMAQYPLQASECDLEPHTVRHISYRGSEYLLNERIRRCTIGAYAFQLPSPDMLVLDNPPCTDATEPMLVRVQLRTERYACQIPRLLYDEHIDVLLDGVRANMLDMRGFHWSDARSALTYRAMFGQGVSAAKSRHLRQYTDGTQNRIRPERMV